MPTPSPDASGWEDAVLRAIGAPVVALSSLCLTLWAQSEGMPKWANNWLATTRSGFGGYRYNKAGVFVYPSFEAGVAATAATIKQHNMAGILTAFRHKDTAAKIFDAINASPWCKGCQGGVYPVALFHYVTTVAPPSTPLPGASPPPGSAPPFPVQGPTQPPDFDWSDSVRQTASAIDGHTGHIHGYAANIGKL